MLNKCINMERKRCDINGIKFRAEQIVSFDRRNEENEDSHKQIDKSCSQIQVC